MKKPINILKAIKGKPSIALQHMVTGLLKQSKRRKFKIDMYTFGTRINGICYGCAATCTIQNIAKKNLPNKGSWGFMARTENFNMEKQELSDFENAINDARQGFLYPLFNFCQQDKKYNTSYDNYFNLENKDWKEQLPEVKKLIKELKKAGC